MKSRIHRQGQTPTVTVEHVVDLDVVNAEIVEIIRHRSVANVATPRTYHTVEEYRPAADRSYYRNDGNKHIKSRGL